MKEVLRKVPLFSGLGEEESAAIEAIVTTKRFPRKMLIVQEGEKGDSMYIIIRGAVKISYYAADGREVVLSLLSAGSFFGEMALLDEEPRSATVMTIEDSELAQIRRSDFERLMLQMPRLTRTLLAEVVRRLRRTSMVLERISTMDVPHRLYDYMREFCTRHGKEDIDGKITVKLPTHQLVADQLSTSRETISRAISALKKEGIIEPLEGRGMVRVDVEALDTLLFAIH